MTRAEGQRLQLRSGLLPQLNANLSYVRTIHSQFQDLAREGTPSSGPNEGSLGSILTRLPFGQANRYTFALSFSQSLYNER